MYSSMFDHASAGDEWQRLCSLHGSCSYEGIVMTITNGHLMKVPLAPKLSTPKLQHHRNIANRGEGKQTPESENRKLKTKPAMRPK